MLALCRVQKVSRKILMGRDLVREVFLILVSKNIQECKVAGC
jgi:hypothetical protein